MFGPFIECFEWVKAHLPNPTRLRKRKLNFLSIHYIYIISLALIGSILLYSSGNIRYIDALFFASGAATQSGLNTVDLNLLNTYQQIVLYLLPMIATPIFIHSVVVFIRLYWFEKRFQHVVREARTYRRTLSRSKTTESERNNVDRVERGVNGRNITVMHNDSQAIDGADDGAGVEKLGTESPEADSVTPGASKGSDGRSAESDRIEHDQAPPSLQHVTSGLPHRDIMFADEVKTEPRAEEEDRLSTLPQQRTAEQHIAFLQRQRDVKNLGTLRIPGPREFDRGDKPEDVESDGDGGALSRKYTSAGDSDTPGILHRRQLSGLQTPTFNVEDSRMKRHLTIEEPSSSRGGGPKSPFPNLRIRKPGTLGRTMSNVTKASGALTPRILRRSGTFSSLRGTNTGAEAMPYLSWTPTVGRNSAFVDLTEEQREELGGIEYRALKTLAVLLIAYYVGFHVLGIITFTPWILRSSYFGGIVSADGVARSWWGFYTSASMLNDLGFTLTPDSMISFQTAVLPLLLGSFFIVIGNTGFPCMLRFVIWFASRVVPAGSAAWEELNFLLDHPRRCFTLLFPAKATWWLFWILAFLNLIDLFFFIVLDLNDPVVTSLKPGYRVLNGWFQATATRTAGFSCVNLALLHPAIQVSYLIMMYISVFPIAISVRRTNVYEEKSLGIYGSVSQDAEDSAEPSYVGAHLRRQLSFDLWYVFLGLFIITIAEASRIQNLNEASFTTFSVLFEIVSAYGTVGLSLGYPGVNASFSSQFTTVSKLVIIAMQIRGRHRGLPYELDRAIMLPSESLHKKEDEDAKTRMQRRNSNLSALEASGGGLFSTHTGNTQQQGLQPQRSPPTAGETNATDRESRDEKRE